MDRMFDAARQFSKKHDSVKKYVHTAWRVPLPKWGQVIMSGVYFSIPVIGGWYVMQWAISKSHESIGERGEKLRIKDVKGIGDQATIGGGVTKIGAGGLGMGVKLAVSDTEDQSRNKKNLMKFFKLEARKRKKQQELSNEKKFQGE